MSLPHEMIASISAVSSLSASPVKMSSTQCGRHPSSAGWTGLGSGPALTRPRMCRNGLSSSPAKSK
eukprot:4557677-Prymnesium_polylepis.1